MALITKSLVLCNKCGKESESGATNVTILGEEFYLCDECLERLIRWVTTQPADEEEDETPSTRVIPRVPSTRGRHTWSKWDDDRLRKLIQYKNDGLEDRDIAEALAVTPASVRIRLSVIRNAKVGDNMYPYKGLLVNANQKGDEINE